MEFPRAVMRLSELKEMGYPEALLLEAWREKGQDFALKQNPLKKNSPIIYHTEGLKKWLRQRIKLENMSQPQNRRQRRFR